MMRNEATQNTFMLKSIYKAILSGWKIIVAIVIIVTLATAAINFFVLSPVYSFKTQITVKLSSAIATEAGEVNIGLILSDDLIRIGKNSDIAKRVAKKYGHDYSYKDVLDHISLNLAGMNKRNIDGQMDFEIEVKGKDKDDSLEFINIYTNEYIQYLKIYYTQMILKNSVTKVFMNYTAMNSTLSLLEEKLSKVEDMIEKNPKLIEADSGIPLIDPLYDSLASQKVNILMNIAETEASIKRNEAFLEKLNKNLSVLNEYLDGKIEEFEISQAEVVNLADSSVYISRSAVLPRNPVAPNKIKNIINAFILSLIISVVIVGYIKIDL